MNIRKVIWVAGAAALLSTQAANAVPANAPRPVDPLVLLSLVGTSQSHAAFCGAAAACAPSASVGAALPASLGAAGAANSAALQDEAGPPAGVDWPGLAVLFFFPVVLIISMATQGGNNGSGPPISPA
jgi:hypothetical protein